MFTGLWSKSTNSTALKMLGVCPLITVGLNEKSVIKYTPTVWRLSRYIYIIYEVKELKQGNHLEYSTMKGHFNKSEWYFLKLTQHTLIITEVLGSWTLSTVEANKMISFKRRVEVMKVVTWNIRDCLLDLISTYMR